MVFKTRYSYFTYQVMPIRLTNVPLKLQDYINKIVAEKPDIFVIVYLDDILIYAKNESKEHVKAIW